MTVKNQWQKVKDNWLLIAGLLIILLVFQLGDMDIGSPYLSEMSEELSSSGYRSYGAAPAMAVSRESIGIMPPLPGGGFAPEIAERKIAKTTSLTSKIAQGMFWDAHSRVLAIAATANAFVLQQNVETRNAGKKEYHEGSYQIKVDESRYGEVASQLKEIGEISSFSENAEDVTASYADTQIELAAERARLERYRKMLEDATAVSDKIELNDRIFNQERAIKYMEGSLENIDERVVYTTIYLQLVEKRPTYAHIAFVTFTQLAETLVESINDLAMLIMFLLPYAAAVLLIWLCVRWLRKKKAKQ